MSKSNRPRPDLFSVEEAALELNVTERTVWNLIKTGKLSYTKVPTFEALMDAIDSEIEGRKVGGRVWISVVDLNRYRLIHDRHFLKHIFSSFPSQFAGPGFATVHNFGPWGASSDSYPQYEVSVDLEDWCRFVAKPFTNETEYEAIKTEIKNLIGPEPPEHFSVRFKINQEALARVLDKVVKSVGVPKLPTPKEDLQGEAMERLINRVLPHLQDVSEKPLSYLRKVVKNFYIDCTRKAHPEIAYGSLDEAEIQPTERMERKGKSGGEHEKPADKDQLWRDLTRSDSSPPVKDSKQSKRKPAK